MWSLVVYSFMRIKSCLLFGICRFVPQDGKDVSSEPILQERVSDWHQGNRRDRFQPQARWSGREGGDIAGTKALGGMCHSVHSNICCRRSTCNTRTTPIEHACPPRPCLCVLSTAPCLLINSCTWPLVCEKGHLRLTTAQSVGSNLWYESPLPGM